MSALKFLGWLWLAGCVVPCFTGLRPGIVRLVLTGAGLIYAASLITEGASFYGCVCGVALGSLAVLFGRYDANRRNRF